MKAWLVLIVLFIQVRVYCQDSTLRYSMYERVDVYNPDGSAKGKGWIAGFPNKEKYKVHFFGCTSQNDETIDTALIKKSLATDLNDPEIKAIMGKWNVQLFDYPAGYNPDPKTPPLQVNEDGSYTWYDIYNKPPFITNWVTCAKVPGAVDGSPHSLNGLLIIDRYQQVYKVYIDKEDHLILQRLCSEGLKEGTRIK